ncbi:mitochondrial import receptor subunit TOM20-like protein [Tanacetum coccineum]
MEYEGGVSQRISPLAPFNVVISKLAEALKSDLKKHDTLWCMGNEKTSYASVTPYEDEAKNYFVSSYVYLEHAVKEYLRNEF